MFGADGEEHCEWCGTQLDEFGLCSNCDFDDDDDDDDDDHDWVDDIPPGTLEEW